MWEWHMGAASGWWILGPIMMIVFWGGLFWLIANVTKGQRSQVAGEYAGNGAKNIAARRFASGEIDEGESSRITDLLED